MYSLSGIDNDGARIDRDTKIDVSNLAGGWGSGTWATRTYKFGLSQSILQLPISSKLQETYAIGMNSETSFHFIAKNDKLINDTEPGYLQSRNDVKFKFKARVSQKY